MERKSAPEAEDTYSWGVTRHEAGVGREREVSTMMASTSSVFKTTSNPTNLSSSTSDAPCVYAYRIERSIATALLLHAWLGKK